MGSFGAGILSGISNGAQAGAAGGAGGQQQGIMKMLSGMGGQKPAAAAGPTPAPTPSPTTTIPNPNPGQQQHGFNGIVPMMKGYYASHQAKVQDAAAAPHIDSLNDPALTPEQQAYHLSNLQSIYAGRPEMLKQYGISPPGAVPISLGQPQGAPNSFTPMAQPVNLGQDQSRTSMTVTSPNATGISGVATQQ